MSALLRAEIRKAITIRSWIVIAGVVLVYPALALLPAISATEPPAVDGGTLVEILRGGADVLVIAVLLLGILAAAGEYRHGTIVPSLLVDPRRQRFVAAKLASQSAVGAVLAVGVSAVGLITGASYLASRDVPVDLLSADVLATVAGVTVVAALYGTIGAAVGSLVRNQTAAVAGALVWIFAVENAIPLILHNPGLKRWLPGGAADRLLQAADSPAGAVSPWVALLTLAALAAGLAAAAVVVTKRADIH